MVQLFAHRGLASKNISQNSIASLKNAYLNHFCAVEFDLWFIEEEIFVVHDRPQKAQLTNLPRLDDYFLYQNEMKYWLDFKNLNQNNLSEALKVVKKAIKKHNIDLKNIYFAPFITDFELAAQVFAKIREFFGVKSQIMAVCDKLEGKNDLKLLNNFLKEEKIAYLSILYSLIDEKSLKTLKNIEIFAWTVNDKKIIEKLSNLGVKNFATDENLAQIMK